MPLLSDIHPSCQTSEEGKDIERCQKFVQQESDHRQKTHKIWIQAIDYKRDFMIIDMKDQTEKIFLDKKFHLVYKSYS